VQRSSPSIGSLAAALAKAQSELVNPEKSLAATIRSEGVGGTEQTFRYAPLSSGLNIVRKTLGQHEIATVQTTSIDQAAGIVNLTTVLAHSSGEWIASDWPVCTLADMASPQRMGAALSYARRYALFTLVGIAGEDDLDAPDLTTVANRTSGAENPRASGNARLNGGHNNPAQRASHTKASKPVLGPEPSADTRDRLLAELTDLGGGDDMAVWAHRSLGEKNKLTALDAQRVEEAFRAKLTTLAANAADEAETQPAGPRTAPACPVGLDEQQPNLCRRTKALDKSALALPEPRRIRDRDHVRSVAQRHCLICGRQPSDAHHLRFAQSRALGRKVSDEFTVPLCRGHHREVHRCSEEAAWWRNAGINPTVAARMLWLETHPLSTRVEGTDSIAGVDQPHASRKRGRRITTETKPIATSGPQ
jgi:ERF superfamily